MSAHLRIEILVSVLRNNIEKEHMAKISLTKPVSGYNLAAINDNFTALEAEFQNKALYRNNPVGEPNTMENDLDLNSNDLLNVGMLNGVPIADLTDLSAYVSGAEAAAITATAASATAVVAAAEAADIVADLNMQNVLRIALIGDSMTAQNILLAPAVGDILERRLNLMGVPSKVYPCNRDGHTYFRANTVAFIGGKTAVQACIDYTPDVVIFCLGINDSLLAVDGRTLAQMKADADTAIAAVKVGVPTAKIVYVSQLPYDSGNFAPATCKNKGIPMYFHKLNTVGILTGYYTSEILESVVDSPTQTGLANWVAFDTYIKANPNIDLSFTLNLWKCARLGGTGNDGVHLNQGGIYLAAGYILKGLRSLTPEFTNLISNNFDWWEDPDYLFSQLLTPSGDGYTYSGDTTSENQNILSGGFLHPSTWYLPVNAIVHAVDSVNDAGSTIYHWSITGADANTQVKVSVNGGAFSNISGAFTDGDGYILGIASGADTGGFSVGVNTLRYAVGNVSLDPKTVAYGIQTIPWVAPTLLNSWAELAPGTYGNVGYSIDRFKRVSFRGVVNGGISGSKLLVLPTGYRPPHTVFLATYNNYLQIDATGDVHLFGTATNVSLGGLSFPIV